ncbi:hypothetical protein FDECE_7962 [Fusarium decemcellulare]|nr:hypothetical protein FDECE_7962 [Fusarium decemcellulare]
MPAEFTSDMVLAALNGGVICAGGSANQSADRPRQEPPLEINKQEPCGSLDRTRRGYGAPTMPRRLVPRAQSRPIRGLSRSVISHLAALALQPRTLVGQRTFRPQCGRAKLRATSEDQVDQEAGTKPTWASWARCVTRATDPC